MAKAQTVLVTGGAGYIGSHVVHALTDAGLACVVVDDLSTGHAGLLPPAVPLVRGTIGNGDLIEEVCRRHEVAAALHFAGSIVVGESVTQPLAYYHNNTSNSRTFIEALLKAEVKRLVFSSTAAVYGAPEVVPITEDAPMAPVNPYGASKLMTEWMLRDAAAAHGLVPVVLRYFNVAGADPALRSGQVSRVATHLIKIACQLAVGQRSEMFINGTDYPTPDGTCVRDYIHVSDLADAHVAALRHLLAGGGALTLNCGYGRGFSVREVVAMVEKVVGRKLAVHEGPRRAGDPPELVAAADRLRAALDWQPRHDSLEGIVASALAWEEKLLKSGG